MGVPVVLRRLAASAALLGMAWSAAPSALAQSRGELLYAAHCITCHSAAIHWRDKRAATDWQSLSTQVRRWQAAASLSWSDDDVLEVVRFLNDGVYHFERPADPMSSVRTPPKAPPSAPTRLAPRRLPSAP
jgi:hypothetical protein